MTAKVSPGATQNEVRFTPASTRTRRVRKFRRNLPFLLMALPVIIWVLVFAYLPMIGMIIAFKDYRFDKGIFASEWVGFENLRFLLSSSVLGRITFNTLFLNSLFILTGTIVSIAIAIAMSAIQHHWLTRFYQSALFFPTFISWVIVGTFMFALLNQSDGLVNRLLITLGLRQDQLVSCATLLAHDSYDRQPLERGWVRCADLFRGHHGHQPRVLRGGTT